MRICAGVLAGALALFLAGSGIGDAVAHEGAKGVVKQRMDLMDDVRKDMKLISDMMRGNVDFDGEAVARAAGHIAEKAPHVTDLFPKNSLDHPSQARREIWTDWQRFEKFAKDFGSTASALARKANDATSPGDITPEFRRLRETCGGCHRGFRSRK